MKKEKGNTNVIKREVEYHWRISDITSYIKCFHEGSDRNDRIFSPEFSTRSKMVDKWKLFLTVNDSDSAEYKDYLSLHLCSYSRYEEIKTSYTLFYLDSLGEIVEVGTLKYVFSSVNGSGYGYGKFLEKKNLLDNKNIILPNDTLTIGIKLTVFESSITFNDDMTDEPICTMANNYKTLYSDNKEATGDIIFKVDDNEIKAHKAVLLARCPVFAEIFSIKTASKEEPIIIPDVSWDTLDSFLEYIYYDEVINLDDYSEDLLEFASRYKLQVLKEMCAISLHKILHTHNALRLLNLAKECDAPELIEDISEFIAINSVELEENSDYKSIQKSNPALSLILLKKLADLTSNGQLKLKH